MRHLWIIVAAILIAPAISTPAAAANPPVTSPIATEAATPASSLGPPTCRSPRGDGLIVYQDLTFANAIASPGTVTGATLVVMTPEGRMLHRIPLPGYAQLLPLGVGCAIVASVTDHGSDLVNPATGDVHPLTLAGKPIEELFPAVWWQRTAGDSRWALVSAGEVDSALLLDTQTGTLTDLSAVMRALRGATDTSLGVPLSAQFSPDGSRLLLVTDQDAWLLPTASPRGGRRLANAVPVPASFSEDGRQILYAQKAGADKTQVVVQQVDGSGTTVVTSGDPVTLAYWVPGTHATQLLLLRLKTGRVSLLRIPDKQERTLTTLPPATPAQAYFSPSGRGVLIRVNNGDQPTTWIRIDLATRRSQRLDSLTGYRMYSPVGPGIRWLALASFDFTGLVKPGANIVGVDLETGVTHRLLAFAGTAASLVIPPTTNIISGDGRFSIVNDLGANYPGFWLLDAVQGTSRRFSDRVCAAISPDGADLLVSAQLGSSKPTRWRLLLMTTGGTDGRTLAETSTPGGVWVPLPWNARP